MPFNETRLDRSTDKAQGKASMSSPAVAPETSPSQPLFEPPDGRIYPDEDKNPAEVKPERNSGNAGISNNPHIATNGRRFQITSVNAKPLAELSVRKRAQLKAEAKAAKEQIAKQLEEIEQLRLARAIPESVTAQITADRLKALDGQITRTLGFLDDFKTHIACPHCTQLIDVAMTPKDRAQLLNALDRLLERERILRGIAAPAPFRAPRQTRQSSSNTAEPL